MDAISEDVVASSLTPDGYNYNRPLRIVPQVVASSLTPDGYNLVR